MTEDKKKLKEDYTNSPLSQGWYLSHPLPGEEIVISGMAAALPASENIQHFMENLFNKVDMIQGTRWDMKHPDLPPRCGIIPELDKLDLAFFGWHSSKETLDPSVRLLAEKVIEAVFDAGLHPSDLQYTKTGIFNAACSSENDGCINHGITKVESIMECGRAPSFSTLSQYLKLTGPNIVIDTACSSSICALEHAFRAIRFGEVDTAIVTGTHLLRHPHTTLQFYRMGPLSADSSCKVFDANANGYVRSEAVGVILLQKKRDAKRVYAEFINAKTNCDGFKEDGLTFPSRAIQLELLKEVYGECQINPSLLSFLEAHGTGTRVGDPEECAAIDEFFTKERHDSLFIGSVKSNMGHSETSAGICSVIKCILAMETGFIPPNIHFHQPKQEIKGILEGRMTVVTNKTPFKDNRGLIGINSFGFGGLNCHVILKKNLKEKNTKDCAPKDDLPRLVCVSGRTRRAVECLLNAVTFDSDHIRLIHNIFRNNIPSHVYRGYIILSKYGEIERTSESYYTYPKQIYLIFGEINNAQEIAGQFKQINMFVKIYQKMQEYLLASGTKECLENFTSPILSQMIVQIAIVDILKDLKICTKEVIGYSYGTLAAAYFNEIITLEEVFKCAMVFDNSLSSDSKNNEKLLLSNLSRILRNKNLLPKHFCDTVFNKSPIHCDTFDIDSVVLKFGNVPLWNTNEDIDIQTVFSTKSRNHILDLLNMLGKLYCKGQNFKIHKLYPKVEFPVGRGTKMISPYIKWNHDRKLFTLTFNNKLISSYSKSQVSTFKISCHGNWSFTTGHVIDGRNLFPATGYLRLVWEAFACQQFMETDNMKIVFEDCRFLRATTVPNTGELKLQISILRHGIFEVIEEESTVVTGRISLDSSEICQKGNFFNRNSLELKSKDVYKELRLRGYSYCKEFQGIQQCNINATKSLIKWEDNWVTFMDNMLQMKILQTDTRALYVPTYISKLNIDGKKHKKWIADNYKDEDHILLPAFANPLCNEISSGYIKITGLLATPIYRKRDLGIPVIEKYQFIPNCTDLELHESVRVNSQIILENTMQYDIKCIELIDEFSPSNCSSLSPTIREIFEDQPLIKPTITIFSNMDLDISIPVENKNLCNATDCTLIIVSNLIKRKDILDQAINSLQDNGYIITRESVNSSTCDITDSRITVVTNYKNSSERIVMLKKKEKYSEPFPIQISSEDNFDWIDKVKDVIQSRKHDNVILYSEDEPTSGILGLVNCLRREPESSHLRCFFIIDKTDKFNINAPCFKKQLNKQLAINVFKEGSWGTYRHLLLNQSVMTESEHYEIKSLEVGDMSSLKWFEGSFPVCPGRSSIEKIQVQVHYCSLNFKDVMIASGKVHNSGTGNDRLSQEDPLGFEFSGIDANGIRVAGINVPSLSSMIMADRYLSFEVPESMTLEEAATIPVVYATVLYAFVKRARIKRRCSVLIHSATGGVGQAAVRIAQHYECEIFVTLGTTEKRQVLKKLFPKIKHSHIGNSRDTSFEQMIYRETDGRGVDIILNSLSEDKLLASVRCLAKGGKFLEIGKYDLSLNKELSLLMMQKGISFHGIMLDSVFTEETHVKSDLMRMIESGIRDSIIKPLNRTVFDYREIEQAFRYMTTGKHIGKVLLKVKPNDTASKKNICFARYHCHADKTYVIIGGLGGFGLELADWLILRGARKLVLTSRHGVTNGYQKYRLNIWSSYGVVVHISRSDIFTQNGCEALLTEANILGPVEAIFNLAVVLADAIFENQTIESFKTSFGPKAVATKYLDEVSRRLCPLLRDFIVFSSVTCGRGNSGQTNYGMANSVMERICELRRKEGFPAVAIQWGAIGEVGLVAEMQEDHKILEIGGTLQQKIAKCLNLLDVLFTQQESAIVSSMVVAEKRSRGSETSNIVEAITSLIGINDLTSVSHHATLAELGMDSMMAVEIKQMLERDFGQFLTSKEIKKLTVSRLKEIDDQLAKSDDHAHEAKRDTYGYSLFKELSGDISSNVIITKLKSTVEKGDSNANTAFVFPGIDGNLENLNQTVKELKGHIYCLEYAAEISGTSIDNLVKLIKPLIKEKLDSKYFKFIAHSFGGNVALEMAKELESEGYSGKIFLIDTSPSMVKRLLSAIQLKFGPDLQTAILCEILQLYYSAEELVPLKDILYKSDGSQINVFTEILRQKSTLNPDLIQQLIKGILQKTVFCQSYQCSFDKIGAELTLIRASETEVVDDRHDYGLSGISQLPVEVHVVQSNHSSILESNETIRILNDWI